MSVGRVATFFTFVRGISSAGKSIRDFLLSLQKMEHFEAEFCSVVCCVCSWSQQHCSVLTSASTWALERNELQALVKWNRSKWCKESACVVRGHFSGNCHVCRWRGVQNITCVTPRKLSQSLCCVPLCHPVVEPFSLSLFAESIEGKHIWTCQSLRTVDIEKEQQFLPTGRTTFHFVGKGRLAVCQSWVF